MDDNRGIIIDPYCGSGTTLVAAKLLGHDYIGIEISTEYAVLAENRLANSENERKEALSEMAKHVVTRTFSERKENGYYTGRFKGKKEDSKEEQIPLKLLERRAKYRESGTETTVKKKRTSSNK